MRLKLVPILLKRRNLYDIPAGHAAKEEALRQLAEEAKAEFEKTTETWENKPTFHVRHTAHQVVVTTNDRVFGYVDAGTRPHVISSRGGGPLHFTVGGSAKTRPRVISSTQGSRGDTWVSAHIVRHPGTESREFSVIIGERIQRKFAAKFRAVLAAYQTGEAPGL